MHQCYAFDLEPVAQAEQFDAFSFREDLNLGDGEDQPAPVAGEACDFRLYVSHRNQRQGPFRAVQRDERRSSRHALHGCQEAISAVAGG
ncbi:hypothetical protein [Acidithiobacillus ferrivorans]|nr:hypothetical protein [Acidithiobacillus ferrivorans]